MEVEKYVIAGLIGAMVGSIVGTISGGEASKRQYKPTSAYVLELNGDERPDLVVKSKNDFDKFYLIQQKDGTYKELYQIEKSQRESIEEKAREIKW